METIEARCKDLGDTEALQFFKDLMATRVSDFDRSECESQFKSHIFPAMKAIKDDHKTSQSKAKSDPYT